MANIGKLSISLAANPSPLNTALVGVQKKLGGLQGIAQVTSGILAGSFGGAAGAIAGMIPGLGGVAATITNLVGSLVRGVSQAAQEIDKLAKAADRLGISTQALAGLEHAASLAGVGSDKLAASLNILNRKIGQAVSGGTAQAAMFAELGLSAQELAAIPLDQAMGRIADSINALGTPAERAAATMKLFGKGGAEVTTLLAGGSEAIESSRRQMEAMGVAVSRIDAAGVEAMNDAVTTAGKGFTGIWNTITVALAPAVKTVADVITEWFVQFAPVRKVIGDILSLLGVILKQYAKVLAPVQKLIGAIWNVSAKIASGLMRMLAPLTPFIEALWDTIGALLDKIVSAVEFVANVIGGIADFVFGADTAAADAEKQAASMEAAAAAAEAAQAALEAQAKAQQELLDDLDKLSSDLGFQYATMNMTADEAERYRLALRGANTEQLANIQAMQELVEAAKRQKEEEENIVKLRNQQIEAGVRLAESLRTPLEIYQDTIAEANRLLESGAITWQTYERAAMRANEALEQAAGGPQETRLATGLQRGSGAAISAINRSRVQSDRAANEPLERANETLRQMRQEQERTRRAAEQTVEALTQGSFQVLSLAGV